MKGTRFHLDLFKTFCDLAETKSFSKTAARNYLTQSAVSQQLSCLERDLGKRLIDRGNGLFSLTVEGKILLEGSQKILATYHEALDKINKKPVGLTGLVKIETIYSLGLHQLPHHIKSFMRKFPSVQLQIEYNRADYIYANVLKGSCDIGIVAYPWMQPSIEVIRCKKKENLTLVCSPDNALAKKRKVSLKDLQDEKFIAFKGTIPTRQAIDEFLRSRDVHVHITREFDNIETLKRSIEIGAGISILPEMAIMQEKKNGTLVSVHIADGAIKRPVGLIHHKNKNLSKAECKLIQWLGRNGFPDVN